MNAMATIKLGVISSLHQPANHYRISPNRYTPGDSFSGATRAGRWYVLSGSCKVSIGPSIWELQAGDVADLPQGEIIRFLLLGDCDVDVIRVWESPCEFWGDSWLMLHDPIHTSTPTPSHIFRCFPQSSTFTMGRNCGAWQDRVVSVGDRRQEQNCLLDIRRQIQQVHDLRQPGASHVPQPGQVRVVAHLAVADQFLEPMGKREEPGHPRDAAA